MEMNFPLICYRKCCHPFKIRQFELYTAPPSWDLLMTSCSVRQITSFSRKRCMIDENFLGNTRRNCDRPFRNHHYKLHAVPSSGAHTKTSFRLATNVVMSEMVFDRRKLWWTRLVSRDRHAKFHLRELSLAPPSGIKAITSFIIRKKIPYLGNGA